MTKQGFPDSSVGKESSCNAGDPDFKKHLKCFLNFKKFKKHFKFFKIKNPVANFVHFPGREKKSLSIYI